MAFLAALVSLFIPRPSISLPLSGYWKIGFSTTLLRYRMPQFIDENTRSSLKLANAIADLGAKCQLNAECGLMDASRCDGR